MKKSYAIVLALFCFSLMSSTVTELDIFDQHLHEVGINQADIDEINSTMATMAEVDTLEEEQSSFDIFSALKGLAIGIKIMLFAFGKTIVIYGTLVGYGVHSAIAGMIQGMVTLVESIALVEFMTARRASQ